MGVSFRKGIKLDSGRVNLSKSRIGFSTGVKGARVGINSRGKLYSSVGRHGIYYRKTYGTKRRAKSSSSSGSVVTLPLFH